MTRILMLVLSTLVVMTISAKDKHVSNPSPGKLKSLLEKSELQEITSLKIDGIINDKDIKVLESLQNLEVLDISDASGQIYYLPVFPKIKELYLQKNSYNNYKETKNGNIYVSDCVRNNTSLEVVYMPGDIASKVGKMPKLRKVGLYDVKGGDRNNVLIDTLVANVSLSTDKYHRVDAKYCGYAPKYIICPESNEVILNFYDPNRTDYKGINVLPVLDSNERINATSKLDLSDVHAIPSRYFEESQITELILSKDLIYVGHDAFRKCTNLSIVTFPGQNQSLKLKDWPFDECDNLKTVTFCGPVELYSSYADGCYTTVVFNKPSVIDISGAKRPFDHFEFNAIPSKINIGAFNAEYDAIVGYVEVPEGQGNKSMSKIPADKVIEKSSNLKTYNISVKKPGTILSEIPMQELGMIESLTVTGFLYETDLKVIEKCTRLKYLDLGKTFITYSPELLKKNQEEMAGLQAVFNIVGAVADAKYNNGEMNSLDYQYSKSFAELVKDATNVSAANEQCIIPANSFERMPLLEEIILPYRAISIKKGVLNDCMRLKKVSLPLHVQYINPSFNNCINLKDIEFPSSIKSIGGFNNCNSLEIVDLSSCTFKPTSTNPVVEWGGAFDNCASLKEIRLPQGITKYVSPDYTFGKDRNTYKGFTVKIYLPETLVDTKDFYAYGDSEIHFKSSSISTRIVPPTDNHKMKIYCPKGSSTAYFNAIGGNTNKVVIVEE